MQVVTVLKNGRVKGRYLVDTDWFEDPNEATKNLISSLQPGYEHKVSTFGEDDFNDGIYKMFFNDEYLCETCKHEYEQKKEVKISVIEFNGKTYQIPEKQWPMVEKNLSYYSEK